jgi:mannose-1-phosphate guanylyltransferase
VTLGAAPARPETGYGYIELSDEELDARPAQDNILESGIGKVYRVARFIEKPDQATAASYAADGKHLWNCGIFGFTARTLMSEIQRTMPGLSTALMEAARVIGSRDFDARLEELYEPLDSISIDHGVMEKTAAPIYVIRADFGWSDVGSWQAVYELQAPRADSDRNVFIGEAIAVDARGNLVMNQGSRLVALLGVDDLVIVDTPDAILVASRKRSQEVRRLVESLKLRGLNKLT